MFVEGVEEIKPSLNLSRKYIGKPEEGKIWYNFTEINISHWKIVS